MSAAVLRLRLAAARAALRDPAWWRRHGLSLLALPLLLAAAVLALGLQPRWAAQEQVLRQELQTLRQRPQPVAGMAAPLDNARWRAGLPESGLRQGRLADLLELGLRQGLNGVRTEHRLSRDSEAGLERLRVTMPLRGSYAQLRAYVGAALAQDEGLSLDSLKLRRASDQDAELEAELVWSLYSRLPAAEVAR